MYNQYVSSTGERRDSTARSRSNADITGISTIGGTSLSGNRSHQDQSCSHANGLNSWCLRIPDETTVVPCSARLVSVSEDIASEDAFSSCEESKIGVDTPGVVPSPSAAVEVVFCSSPQWRVRVCVRSPRLLWTYLSSLPLLH